MNEEIKSNSDIEKSEVVIARILALLMEWGIQDCELQFEELGLEEEFAPFFFPCIDWLIWEGVIRAKDSIRYSSNTTSAGGKILNPQLTSYGFRALGTQITIGDSKPRLANAVREVSQTKRAYAPIGDFVGGLLGGFTKSMGS